ncbi:MAG: hypothetical protein KDB54_02185 [Solirubrobacterales bacterium]|nr:hypothetical protein [Solirubrobacterales bacterium]MCB0859439.1 hypothetical protein [Solirubrobacterales bacterium]
MGFRAAVLLCLCVGALGLAACGGDKSDDNAKQFRDQVAKLEAGVRLDPVDADQPGVVSGSVPTAPGGGLDFTFSFGPDADNLDGQFPDRDEINHFTGGDEYYSSFSNSPSGLNLRQQNERLDLELALSDVACQAAAAKDCERP